MLRCVCCLNLLLVLLASGCHRVAKNTPITYQAKGVVVEVKPDERSVEIKHEEIPGYMRAMTMPFDVKDTNELAGLTAGDPVSFRLNITKTYGWIDQIQKTG